MKYSEQAGQTSSAWVLPRTVLVALVGMVLYVIVATCDASSFDSFPLWKDAPGKSVAKLGEGRLKNGTRWGVYASRVGASRASRAEPCISVARITAGGRYGDAHGCGRLAPQRGLDPPVYVTITGSGQNEVDGPVIGESVIGMTFKPKVSSVLLRFSDSTEMQQRTRLFNAKQMKKTSLARFRYIALGLQRDVCVQEIVGYGATGTELFSKQTNLC